MLADVRQRMQAKKQTGLSIIFQLFWWILSCCGQITLEGHVRTNDNYMNSIRDIARNVTNTKLKPCPHGDDSQGSVFLIYGCFGHTESSGLCACFHHTSFMSELHDFVSVLEYLSVSVYCVSVFAAVLCGHTHILRRLGVFKNNPDSVSVSTCTFCTQHTVEDCKTEWVSLLWTFEVLSLVRHRVNEQWL